MVVGLLATQAMRPCTQLLLGDLAQHDLELLLHEFEVEGLLGSGGMARVWGARDRSERVAIKVMLEGSRNRVSCERSLRV